MVHGLRLTGYLTLALTIVMVLGWLVLQWAIVPRLDHWRPNVERHATQSLGVKVRIDRLEGRRDGLLPSISIHGLSLLDAQDHPALTLPLVETRLSLRSFWPGSLWQGEIRLDRLVIESPELDVKRDASGRIHVAGVVLATDTSPAAKPGDGAAADWLFSQSQVLIHHGSIRWIDEVRQAPPLLLRDVELNLRNGPGLAGRRHDLDASATPPARWGEHVSLQARLTQPLLRSPLLGQALERAFKGSPDTPAKPGAGPASAASIGTAGAGKDSLPADLAPARLTRPGDWRNWRGVVDAAWKGADVSAWRAYFDLPFELSSGLGDVQASLQWKDGSIQGISAEVALRDVRARLAPSLQPLLISRLKGSLSGEIETLRGGLVEARLAARSFGFTTPEGWIWPQGDVTVSWQGRAEAADAPPPQGSAIPQPPPAPPLLALPLLDIHSGKLSAQRLDLRTLKLLAERLPLPQDLRQQLLQRELRGELSDLDLRFTGPLAAPTTYSAHGALKGLAWATVEEPSQMGPPAPQQTGLPGLAGADAQFDLNERGGKLSLSVRQGMLEFPGVFEEPRIPMTQLDAHASWRLAPVAGQAPKIELRVDRFSFANADAQGSLHAQWHTGDGAGTGLGKRYPGVLKLEGQIDAARALAVPRYLPLGVSINARRYLKLAVREGNLSKVQFKLDGDLWDAPFPAGTPGIFRVSGLVKQARFAYVPDDPPRLPGAAPLWPLFTELDGELIFEGESMSIRNARARLGSVGSGRLELNQVNGRIPNLSHHSVLQIEGRGHGPLPDLLRYVQTTPISRWTAHALSDTTGDGWADLDLALTLPLYNIDEAAVKGSVQLSGNALNLSAVSPPMNQVKGRIAFTERGVQVQATAQTLGGSARIEGGSGSSASAGDSSMRFVASGSVSAEGLKRYAEQMAANGQTSPALARLSGRLSGLTAARVNLGFVHGQPDWTITSNLVGMAVNLPAPLNKTADQPLALRVQLGPIASASNPSDPTRATDTRDALRVDLGSLLQIQYQRELSGNTPRVLRGAIGLMQPARLPASGVEARGSLGTVDADAWLASLLPASSASAERSAADADSGYLPQRVDLRARELRISGRHFTGVTLAIAKQSSRAGPAPATASTSAPPSAPPPDSSSATWDLHVDADQIKDGRIELSLAAAREGGNIERVKAHFARLALPATDPSLLADAAADDAKSASASHHPSTWEAPALDITADEFELAGRKLGKLEVQAELAARGTGAGAGAGIAAPPSAVELGEGSTKAARAWRLNNLTLTNADARLSANGSYAPKPHAQAQARTRLDFSLDLINSGNLLTRLGQPQTVRGGKGSIKGQLAWAGPPLAPSTRALDGQLKIAIESGQILKVDPGVARLLGVLTLQSLPRRLSLDFRDLFAEGFAFDRIDGDLGVGAGHAYTRNLRMRGVQAMVLMEGDANLADETQDLHVWVVPEINAGAASLAYAAINPVAGLGSFVAQYLLREPLRQANTREYRVTGSWIDPKVDKVTGSASVRPPNARAAEAAAGASAAASASVEQ